MKRLQLTEVFGLKPYRATFEDAKMVFRGDPSVPPSRFDPTSLRMFTPRLSVATWLGRRVAKRTIPLLNLFNRNPTPVEEGWSVKVTQARDFRGRQMTYDSHNGTDFVIPPGTVTVASAAGRVASIRREWNRGGLKLYLDHGDGLMTTHNHLARALADVGDTVERGQPVALTGYSGIDGFVTFPWLAPHVHYNVILGGVLVDPFAQAGETSLWREHNAPCPRPEGAAVETVPATVFDPERVQALLADLKDDRRRALFARIDDVTRRGWELVIESTVYPTRFETPEAGRLLYAQETAREPRLDLPFRAADFDDTGFADDLGYR
ncbi:MAG: hypothetical protein AUK47_17270 [Deltaproteobacteria bacterium CG2_30_63_29]|nr:MAG: hypothetical protein AUK47_17270 [Deltaproteobacteria bacterium CG2_30_63_29]